MLILNLYDILWQKSNDQCSYFLVLKRAQYVPYKELTGWVKVKWSSLFQKTCIDFGRWTKADFAFLINIMTLINRNGSLYSKKSIKIIFTIFGSDETGRNSCHLPELLKLHKFSKCCSFVIFHFTIKNYTQFIPTYCVVSKFRKSGTYPMYVSDSRGYTVKK